MKKFDPKRSLWLYKLWEYLLLFDGSSEEERMLAYRYGWHIFSNNRQHFEDFSNFIRRRKWFIYMALIYPILITFFSLLLALSVLKIELTMKVPLALIFSGITAGIIYNLIGNTLKNIRETGIFLRYVDPNEKLANFREFENLDFMDKEAALLFYENMRAKLNYATVEPFENKLGKTEKLLVLDFLLGEPGSFNHLINKLCLDPNSGLTKEGIYRVLGEILAASPDNIKKDLNKGIKEIRIGEKLSKQRLDQLKVVKAIFADANLPLKVKEIERMIPLKY